MSPFQYRSDLCQRFITFTVFFISAAQLEILLNKYLGRTVNRSYDLQCNRDTVSYLCMSSTTWSNIWYFTGWRTESKRLLNISSNVVLTSSPALYDYLALLHCALDVQSLPSHEQQVHDLEYAASSWASFIFVPYLTNWMPYEYNRFL